MKSYVETQMKRKKETAIKFVYLNSNCAVDGIFFRQYQ